MSEKFKRLPWSQAVKGQKVWIQGTADGEFKAYGPHEVFAPDARMLASGTPVCKGRTFMHYAEDLLVPAN